MANQGNKVTAGDIVSATRRYSNKDNADRKFNISADVNIQNGKAVNFNNGSVTKKDEPVNGSANFSKGEGWLSFNSNNLSDAETKSAFSDVMDFMSDVESNVESIPVE